MPGPSSMCSEASPAQSDRLLTTESFDGPVTLSTDGSVATITIDRAEARNALSPGVVTGLSEALTVAEALDEVSVAVLTGAGDKAFCAGGDLGGMTDTGGRVGAHLVRAEVGELVKQMRVSRLPIVARVNGHALAGGFGLMLACDLVVAADDAEMGTPEVNLGLWPFMITALIQRDIPRKIAMDLMLTGKRITALTGERWGFVNTVVPRADLDSAVAGLTSVLSSKSPLVVSLGKRSFYRAEDMPMDAAIDYLAGMLTLCLESEDTVEGVSAFFQKRPPEWKNR